MKIPDLKTLNKWLWTRDAPAFVQFGKYGVCGVASIVVLNVIVYLLGYTVLPAMEGMTVDGAPISDDLRERNLILANVIAFLPSNVVAYTLNALWVFTPGRHSRWKEFGLFTFISAIGFFAGLLGGPKLIGWFGVSSHIAQLSLIVTSALVNYVCRKFLVFLK